MFFAVRGFLKKRCVCTSYSDSVAAGDHQPLANGIADKKVRFTAKTFDSSPIDEGKGVHAARTNEQRELDARRASIECENHLSHGFVVRLLCARSNASAQEALRARGLSERLVKTIGTRAPKTMPAACASAKYSNC
jgi:hypothetical protein